MCRGTIGLTVIHTEDADGISYSDLYDTVTAGDLVEGRQADDWRVRYRVTDVLADPAGNRAPHACSG